MHWRATFVSFALGALVGACGGGGPGLPDPRGEPPTDGGEALDSGSSVDDAGVTDAGVPRDAGLPADAGTPAPLVCRHQACVQVAGGFATSGRLGDAQGRCGEGVVVDTVYPTQAECEAVPFRALPKLLFYGNLGAWGSLGLDDNGTMWKSVAEVSARFGSLCAQKRAVSAIGNHLTCQADLIAIAPNNAVSSTQAVAERLLADHGARVSLDVRTKGQVTYAALQKQVDDLFAGKTSAVSSAFLTAHPVGLSLDFEPQVVDGHMTPTAAITNAICGVYKARMLGYGHKAEDLECFTYEYGYPMVSDASKLEPWIYPVLMSMSDRNHAIAELKSAGLPVTEPNIVARALLRKEYWIDHLAAAYSATPVTGCMFADAAYLTVGQADAFTFAQGVAAYGHKCDVYSFQ